MVPRRRARCICHPICDSRGLTQLQGFHGLRDLPYRAAPIESGIDTCNTNGRRAVNILIADGAQLIRERLVREIATLPGVAQTVHSFDFNSTRQRIKMLRPDIIVLDMFLPGGTALAVLRHLNEAGTRVRSLVLSSSPDRLLRERCLAAGAEHYLLKSSELIKAIDLVGEMVTGR